MVPPDADDSNPHAIGGRWLKALTEGSSELVALVDGDGSLQFLGGNRASTALLGVDAADLAAQGPSRFVHPEDAGRASAEFRELAKSPGAQRTIEVRLRHKNGAWVRVEVTGSNRLDDSWIRAVVVHARAVVDSDGPLLGRNHPLTNLPDRSIFTSAVAEVVDRTRAEPGRGFSVFIIEIDKLKMLVGTYGQQVIDELVVEVGRRLASLLAPTDTLAHVGPAEFAILMDGQGDRTHASRTADRIQKTLAARYRVGEHTITASAIVGIATSERKYEHAEHVIRDAALAANRARGPGLRRAVFQTQMRVEDSRYMQILGGLYGALQANQFRLQYQPIVSLVTGQLAGFEALVRWHHPEQGVISPLSFIPVAEETGLIVPIGQWVLQEACRQLAAWNKVDPGARALSVAVNLSAKQFVEEDLAAQVQAAVTATGIAPEQLKLEITETTVMENQDSVGPMIRRIKDSGVRLSLDDFGTGYSSFSYLHQLPYDTLKIDRSFVSRLEGGDDSNEIVHAIIDIAHHLGMDVVGEGVETARQVEKLRAMKCEYAQGYHFAKPLSADDAGALIVSKPVW